MELSVLDYGVVVKGKTARDALKDTVRLAQRAEQLGYQRFWVAEHHNISAFSTSSPEVLMMHLADRTQHIRIGSGGVMALHYSSYKIAENFKTLEAIHPNRIDLGMGSFLGSHPVHRALNSIHTKSDYPEVLATIQRYLTVPIAPQLPVRVTPLVETMPQMWTLSNSEQTAQWAGELGMGYTFGVFPYMQKNPLIEAPKVSQTYFNHFRPTAHCPNPQLMVAAFIVIGDTDEVAEKMAQSLDLWMLGNQVFNEFEKYPDKQDVGNYQLTDLQRVTIKANRERMIIGGPERVKEQLDTLIQAAQANEVLVIPLVPTVDQRIRSLELLAQLYK
ncbi:LLM class flavin-dependent oxidoreductase [Atopobacter phocae]|uniref:LLM class flavin-dependent oxidoreductase n=1 Tax=Atopobacter phocae TaxID=136492 RepID=UPI00046F27AE|nr:LLM class flavin-dependent oxidoreductase [Atopobacter phocae]